MKPTKTQRTQGQRQRLNSNQCPRMQVQCSECVERLYGKGCSDVATAPCQREGYIRIKLSIFQTLYTREQMQEEQRVVVCYRKPLYNRRGKIDKRRLIDETLLEIMLSSDKRTRP